MTEYRPREIQLTSKQLVFVFMSTVLVAVVVFLLGVWVGRGIDVGSAAATDDVAVSPPKATPTDSPATGTTPPPSGYDYPKILQGQSGSSSTPPGGQAPAGPPAGEQPPTALPALPPPPVASATQERPQPPPTKPAPPPDPPAKAPADDGDPWVIQAGAYSNKHGADKVAAEFRGKGYNVSVTPGPTFRVWIGPYPKKAAAEQVAARLRKEWRDLQVIRPR